MLNKKKNRTNWTNWCPKHLEITKKLMKNLITVIGQKVTERETFQQKRCQEITKVITISDISNTSNIYSCLLYTSPSPRDGLLSRMPSSA